MGQDKANIYAMVHVQGGGPVWSDFKLRCHWGNQSIQETAVISFWPDVVDAWHNGTAAQWADAVDDVKAEFSSFTWTQDWTDALEQAADLFKA